MWTRGVATFAEKHVAARGVYLEPYRLDPLRMLREGLVKVWDPEAS